MVDVHLTNVAVQKTAPDYDPEKGCKWSVRQLRTYLVAKHGQKAVSISVRLIAQDCGTCLLVSSSEDPKRFFPADLIGL